MNCPADAVAAGGTVCRAAAGVCDAVETCNGASSACPTDRYLSSATICRAAAGLCDAVEYCPGNGINCPADAVLPVNSVCRNQLISPGGGTCDVTDKCDGVTVNCPDAVKPAGTSCWFSQGLCDATVSCDGISAICHHVQDAGTSCGSAAGPCASPPSCDGGYLGCQPGTLLAAGSVCRSAAGACDVAETCSGATATCPADQFLDAGTVCRAATGVCDVAEVCAGDAGTCPADGFAPSATTCNPGTPNELGICASGSCVVSCAAGYADCNADAGDGCETAIATDILNCGACNHVCSNALGTPLCGNGNCATSAHLATAVNLQSVSYPGGTTPVPVGQSIQFTVRVPNATPGVAAEVWYFLDANLVFQSASAGGQGGTICTAAAFTGAFPNGVEGTAQTLDCLLTDGSVPLVMTANASGYIAPSKVPYGATVVNALDDPYAAVACFAPFTTCVPVRVAVQPATSALVTTGPLRTALVLASGTGAPAHPYANTTNTASVFYSSSNPSSAYNYFLQSSGGTAKVAGAAGTEGGASDIYGPFTISGSSCMSTSTVMAVAASSINLANYERIMIVANDPTLCGAGGLSGSQTFTVAGQPKVIPVSIVYNGAYGDTTLNGKTGYALLHEYGHNLGLMHAGGWECGATAIAFNGTCNNLQYDDYSDEMGAGQRAQFNPVHKEQLGWLEGLRAEPIWTSGTYVINAYEDPTENVKVLKIPRKLRQAGSLYPNGIATGYYYLAARRPVAPFNDWISTAPAYANGVAIYMDENTGNSSTAAIDVTPNSASGPVDFADAALLAGQTFTDSESNISITVVSSTATQATVSITIGARSKRFVEAAASDAYGGIAAGATITGVGDYTIGSSVTLTGVPPSGYQMFFWESGVGGWHTVGPGSSNQQYTFTVTDDVLVWATFKAVAPTNDNFAAAQAITTLPTQVKEFTQSATTEAGEPTSLTCNAASVNPDCTVWFSFTAPTTQTLVVDTAPSDYFTTVAVYTGSAVNALTLVPGDCSIAGLSTLGSHVSFSAVAGTTYYIQVGATNLGQNLVVNFTAGP